MRRLVTGVIVKNGKVLVLKRKLNWKGWELVKGRMGRETPRQALLREIKEETGLKVKIEKKLGEVVYRHKKIHGHTESRQTVYLVQHLKNRVVISSEHSGYKWVNPRQAEKMLTYSNQRKFVKNVIVT